MDISMRKKSDHEKTGVGDFVETPKVAARPSFAFSLKYIINNNCEDSSSMIHDHLQNYHRHTHTIYSSSSPSITIVIVDIVMVIGAHLASLHVGDVFFLLSVALTLAILPIILGPN